MTLTVSACQDRPTTSERDAIGGDTLKTYTCDLLRRVIVTPQARDVISKSTMYEICTSQLYHKANSCKPAIEPLPDCDQFEKIRGLK